MKILAKWIIGLAVMISSSVWAQSKSYVIEGHITGPNPPKKIYFAEGSFQAPKPSATKEIPVKQGKYIIKSKLDEPRPVWISLKAEIDKTALNFIADEGTIQVETAADLKSEKISGSKFFDDVKAYRDSKSKITDAQEKLNFSKKYVLGNPNSFMALMAVSEFMGITQDYLQADTLFKTLSPAIQATPTAKVLADFIAKNNKLNVGFEAPDFTQNTPEGTALSLSSLRGKYVLLDFWASWCGPCRQENPNVVAAYQKFKDKGFTILGVSLDRSKENWEKAIKDDNLTWQHVSDLKYWNSEAGQLYGINSIPANFLIDPNGKIIAKNLRGEELMNKLAEVLN